MDLSIARWIQGMRREKSFETTGIRAKYTDTNDETAESNLNNDVSQLSCTFEDLYISK